MGLLASSIFLGQAQLNITEIISPIIQFDSQTFAKAMAQFGTVCSFCQNLRMTNVIVYQYKLLPFGCSPLLIPTAFII